MSSSTSHKKTLKLWNYGMLFFFLVHSFMNRFWEKILSMLTLRRRTFYIKWSMTSKVIWGQIRPFMFLYLVQIILAQIVCALLSPIPTKREGGSSLFALWMLRRKLRFSMILKLGFMWPLLCYGILKKFPIFWSNYNLDLRSYGQLLSLFCIIYSR